MKSFEHHMNNKISYFGECIDSLANDIKNGLKPNPRLPSLIMVLTNNTAEETGTEGHKANEKLGEQKRSSRNGQPQSKQPANIGLL